MSALDAEKSAGENDVQIELAAENDGDAKQHNGLAQHVNIERTPEEIAAEKRFLRKCDMLILPLLSIMYFLASLVRISFEN